MTVLQVVLACLESAAAPGAEDLQPCFNGHWMKTPKASISLCLSPAEQQQKRSLSTGVTGFQLKAAWLRAALPDLGVAVTENLSEQLGGLMEAATQLIQLLLHGENPLLQLPIGVVPIGAEVAHDHLHLFK